MPLHSSNMLKQKLHHFCNRSSPDDGPKSPESTRDTYNYGQYINQFPPNTIKVIREFERIQKKIYRHKMSIMFNEICINEEMLPKYTYIYMYVKERFVGPNREKIIISKWIGPIRDLFFSKELFISFLPSRMFPACCFRQRTFNNLQGFWLKCGTRPYEWGTLWNLYKVSLSDFFRFCIGLLRGHCFV